jgi:hypothetical protein
MEDKMKFNIPKIIRPLEMSAYAEEMEGLALHVWVNPTRNIKNEFDALQIKIFGLKNELEKLLTTKKPDDKKADALSGRLDAVNKSIYEWYANALSQASDPETHTSAYELNGLTEEDPALWIFIATGVQALIGEHAEGIRKN